MTYHISLMYLLLLSWLASDRLRIVGTGLL